MFAPNGMCYIIGYVTDQRSGPSRAVPANVPMSAFVVPKIVNTPPIVMAAKPLEQVPLQYTEI